MNICYICDEYFLRATGGIGSFLRNAAKWLVRNGHNVKVIGCYEEHSEIVEQESDEGVEVYRIKYPPGKLTWIKAWWKQYNTIRAWIDSHQIDIVEAPDSRGWFAFWGKTGVPLVIRANGSQTAFNRELGDSVNFLTSYLERKSYERADFYCGVSKYIANINTKWFGLKKAHTVIYNAPCLSENSRKKDREKNLIVYSGTLIKRKGVFNLIKASIALHTRNVPHTLILNGRDHIDPRTGSTKKLLEALIPPHLTPHFIFNGAISQVNLFDYYRRATVAVFPSYMEAFANAPMEAMAMGCPTIYTKKVSGTELIEDGKDGILVDPLNIGEIANKIEWCVMNPSKATKIGQEGFNKINKLFNFNNIMYQNLSYYRDITHRFAA